MSSFYNYFTAGETPFKVMSCSDRFGYVRTTSTAWTEVVRYALTEYTDLVGSLTVRVTGLRSSNNDGLLFVQEVGVKRIANGNADIVGVLPSPKISADPSLSLATFRVIESGNDVVVDVKAPNSNTMDWCGQIAVEHLFGRVA